MDENYVVYLIYFHATLQVHMRVHSSVSYGETELHVCPLCLICYHNADGLDGHKIEVHPDWENDIQKLRKCTLNCFLK